MNFAILVFLLFIAEIFYFRLASRYNIIDTPNERSAHSKITIRGGGILFWLAAVIYFFYSSFQHPYFFFGLTIVALVSFLDDILTLPNRFRLPIQFLGICLTLIQINLINEPYWVFACIMVLGVGILNAYNFMDGINGITGGYSMVAITTFWFFNNYESKFIENDFLYSVIASLLVFNYYNFRTKAKCFAGDVGSVSLGIIVIFLLFKLISLQNQYYYILILAVYGVDSVLTILQRIIKRENIFKAHNSHFFQVLVRNRQIPHLIVSGIYMGVQLAINLLLISIKSRSLLEKGLVSFFIISILASIYLVIKPKFPTKN